MQFDRKVFGLGLSRTGTTSLAEALNLLGIKTAHFPSDAKTFEELKSGNYRLTLLGTFQGAVDISVAPFFEHFDRIYPGSKFILTVRNLDSWLNSVKGHWRLAERWSGPEYPFIQFIRTVVYGSMEFDEDRFRSVYERHCSQVREYFAGRPNDLLVMDICNGEGWEKLCPFVGMPVPEIPFPNRNQSIGNWEWAEALDSAVANIASFLSPATNFALVGNGKLGVIAPGILPTENRNGLDWGGAKDDQEAIEEMQRLRENGVRHLVFLFPFFWWFEYYREWNQYMKSHSRCIAKTDHMMILELI